MVLIWLSTQGKARFGSRCQGATICLPLFEFLLQVRQLLSVAQPCPRRSQEETQELDRMFEEEARPPVLSGDKVEAFSFAHPDAPRPPDPPAAPDLAPDPDPEPQ